MVSRLRLGGQSMMINSNCSSTSFKARFRKNSLSDKFTSSISAPARFSLLGTSFKNLSSVSKIAREMLSP